MAFCLKKQTGRFVLRQRKKTGSPTLKLNKLTNPYTPLLSNKDKIEQQLDKFHPYQSHKLPFLCLVSQNVRIP